MSNTVVPFENTFMQASVAAGRGIADRDSEVVLVAGEHTSIVAIYAGGIAIYMNVATARSVAAQIMTLTDNGCDPLWETEPMTGEEEDRWAEDIRAGAIGGDVQ